MADSHPPGPPRVAREDEGRWRGGEGVREGLGDPCDLLGKNPKQGWPVLPHFASLRLSPSFFLSAFFFPSSSSVLYLDSSTAALNPSALFCVTFIRLLFLSCGFDAFPRGSSTERRRGEEEAGVLTLLKMPQPPKRRRFQRPEERTENNAWGPPSPTH